MPEIPCFTLKRGQNFKKSPSKRGGFQFSELTWAPAFDGTDTTGMFHFFLKLYLWKFHVKSTTLYHVEITGYDNSLTNIVLVWG